MFQKVFTAGDFIVNYSLTALTNDDAFKKVA
jgi:hypothetical protein